MYFGGTFYIFFLNPNPWHKNEKPKGSSVLFCQCIVGQPQKLLIHLFGSNLAHDLAWMFLISQTLTATHCLQ